ncbi:MAG: GGDEF domain-containing protein [Anaerolineaceae bacterium]|nr:GGDEF domain-containing protein [Anaerolineaceae bacterium]
MHKKNKKHSEVIKYTIVSVIFGSIFPLLSTSIDIIEHGYPFNLPSFFSAQKQNPLLWIIDTAILVLGFFGYQAGIRQQKLSDQADHLEELVNERSEEILRQKLFYEALMEDSPIAIATLDQHHRVLSVNPAFEAIFGYRMDKIIGKNLDDLVSDPANKREAYDITKGVLAGKTMHEFGKRRRADGSLVDVEILGEPIEINGKRIGVLGLYRDITVEKLAREELSASEERFRRMFQDSPVALQLEDFSQIKQWVLETQKKSGQDIRDYLEEHPDKLSTMFKLGKIISVNAAALFLFRAKDKAHLEKNFYSIVISESYKDQIDIICALLDGETTLEKEIVYKNLNGEKVYAITKFSILPGSEEDWSRVLFSNMDITQRKLAEERLSYISLHDMMTGIYNRAFFEEELARMEKSRLRPISILVSDMDNLKKINDQYGHKAGDIALQHVANIFKKCFRSEDVIARIGGDEFSILLPDVSEDHVKQIKQRVLDQFALHNQSNGKDMPISISIGCGTAHKGDLLADVFKLADERMYQEKQIKKKGKKRVD